MYIVMPYSLYEGESKVTPKEYRLYVLLNKKCLYESGIKEHKTTLTNVDILHQLLQFDKNNDRRSRGIIIDCLTNLRKKGYINFDTDLESDKRKAYSSLLSITFNHLEPYHPFDADIYNWTEDEDELMIVGLILKWSKTNYLITIDEYSKMLGYSEKTKTIRHKLKSMCDKGVISNEKGKWNVEKQKWTPNKQVVNKEYEPDKRNENVLENLNIETRKHRFYSDWKDEPLRVEDFEILLSSTDKKWVEKVRKKLENIANKNSTMAEMFQRLEDAAIEEIEKSKQMKSLYNSQMKRIEHEHMMYENGLKNKLSEIRQQEQIERENRPDLTMLWDDSEQDADRSHSDDEYDFSNMTDEESYRYMSND